MYIADNNIMGVLCLVMGLYWIVSSFGVYAVLMYGVYGKMSYG